MKKICFMLLGNPPNNDTDVQNHWLKFIETVDNNTCVFINHPMDRMDKEEVDDYKRKNNYLLAFEKKLGNDNIYILNKDDNTHIKTMWANISIVYAEIMMIQESIMKFGLCERYILISNSCCPLYNYNTIYETIMSEDKSWISIMSPEPFANKELVEMYQMNKKDYLDKTSNIFNYYAGLKISQWMILTKKHVRYMFSNSTLEQRENTYLYDGELECNSGIVSKIKYNDNLKDTNCDKENCIDDIKILISTFDKIIKSELPNCAFVPYDEYAIQQFVLNKILNNCEKNKYLTDRNELLNILKNEFKIMSFQYIKSNLEVNYSKLNKKITDFKLDFIYNEPLISQLNEDSTINKIKLSDYPSIIRESEEIIKNGDKINTYNTIYFGKKFIVYPCYSINFPRKFNYYYGPNCKKMIIDDYIFISSTYTNWLLVTNNLSNYSRELIFKKTLSEEEIDRKILEEIFLAKVETSKTYDEYLSYIKQNSPLFFELKINECLKKIYKSDTKLPDDYQKNIEDIKKTLSGLTPPIPPSEELSPNYHLNETLRFFMEIGVNPFFFLNEQEKDINLYPTLQDFLSKIYYLYKKNNCDLKYLNNLILEKIKKIILGDMTSKGIDMSYHPSEYYITENRENMFLNVSNYFKKILCFIKEQQNIITETNFTEPLENFINKYKLPSLSIKKYGNPLDKYTLIPIILSGTLFVRKCVSGCSIDKFTKDLFSLDYIYKDYFDEEIVSSSLSHSGPYFKKYLKYKNKYLKLKKI